MDNKLNKIVAFLTNEKTDMGLSGQPGKQFRQLAEEIMQRTDSQALLNEVRTSDGVKHVTVFTLNEKICADIIQLFKNSGIAVISGADCTLTKMALLRTSIVEVVISAFEPKAIEIQYRQN